jgi:ribosome-associated protein
MSIKLPYRAFAIQAARAADEKKGIDIVVLDIHASSDLTDFVVIASAESSAQQSALQRAIEDVLRQKGLRALHRDGGPRDRWMVVDYGAIMVHILLAEARDFYRLDQLWETSKKVAWEKRS